MEVEVTQENLTRALSNASRIAQNKTPLPILSNILLRTNGNRLLVAATNLELASSSHIGVKIVKQGEITVPARLITEFVNHLPKQNVTLKVKNDQLTITSGHYTSTINGTLSDDFPELPEVNREEAVVCTLPVIEAKEAFSQTIITASNDSTRPVLTGVYWHSIDGNVYIAATDGYRLSERKLSIKADDVKAIIPTSTLQEVLRVVSDDASMIEIVINEAEVHFIIDDTTITSRLIDGAFPDYRQLIPTSFETVIELPKADFVRITKVASLFARDSGGSVTLNADSETKLLSIHSIASELGENTSEAPAQSISSNGAITLNSRYLIDALSVVSADKVMFRFNGKLSATVLSSSEKDANYIHIIMPLKS